MTYRIKALLFDGNKIDIVKYNLSEIAQYVSIYNPESSKIIARMDQLIQLGLSGDDILNTHTSQIESLWDDIGKGQEVLSTVGDKKYSKILTFIKDLRPSSKEVFRAIGKDQPAHYLVILQNSSEKRPNGWFFWSFALLTLHRGRVTRLKMIDSYFPQKYMPQAAIRLPERSHILYPSNQTNWIAANKFWFNDADGKTLIALYDETFNKPQSSKNIPDSICRLLCDKQIHGVLFVRTDTIAKLLPEFTRKQREWQFLNANIDIIRGKTLPNKKEKYLEESQKLFEEKKGTIIKQFINKFDELTQYPSVGLFIPSASPSFTQLLSQYHILTTPQPNSLYIRDTNTSFNKIDEFVDKKIVIQDHIGDTVLETNSDIVSLSWLTKGEYTMTITYHVSVPEQYKNYIFWLEAQYGIQMTDRERGILALEATDKYDDKRMKLWANKSQIYYPNTLSLTAQWWEWFELVPFSTPRWQGLQYKLETANNNDEKKIIFKIVKK